MFIRNGRRFNLDGLLDAVFVDDQGIQHPGQLLRDPAFRAQHGIEEIPDPIRGNDDVEYTQEIDVAPYIIITPKSPEQIEEILKTKLSQAVQGYMDEEAQLKGYDGILSAASYAGYTNAFQAEGISFANWRSACWTYCYQVLADVKAGTRTAPTKEELLAELATNVPRVLPV